jgi:L-arabinose isomerase
VTRSIVPDLSTYEVWFLTGSQNLYGDETLRQVAEQSQQVVAGLQAAASIPVTVVWKPTLVDSASILRVTSGLLAVVQRWRGAESRGPPRTARGRR